MRIARAEAVQRGAKGRSTPVELRAKTFVVAAGYVWSSRLLLLAASSRVPNGVANRSGAVGSISPATATSRRSSRCRSGCSQA